MNSKRTMLLKLVRGHMIGLLQPGCGYAQRELQEKIHKDEHWGRNHSPSVTYVLIGECVRIYGAEFYRDPATGRIFLTRRALVTERVMNGRTEEEAGRDVFVGAGLALPEEGAASGAPTVAGGKVNRSLGNTACGLTSDFLEAKEA